MLIRNKELNEVNKLKEDELKALKNKIKSLNDEIQLICSLRENERHECITETNKLREGKFGCKEFFFFLVQTTPEKT